jgi:plastocyanin
MWRRRIKAAAMVGFVAITTLPLIAAPARAGGGCHGEATEATGTVVVLAERCFGPTVLRVAPGAKVTWINRDYDVHNVTGFGYRWGTQGDLRRGDRFSTTFSSQGVYPYTCYLHPGMNGAVVVGEVAAPAATDGLEPQSGTTVAEDAAAPKTSTQVVAAGQTTAGSAGPWPALAGIGFALAFAGGLALIWLRRRMASTPVDPS